MKNIYKISWIIIPIQILLIAFAKIVDYYFHHTASDKWIFFGEKVMKFQFAPILFFIGTFVFAIFIKGKRILKIVIMILSVIGFIVFNWLYLYPW